MINQLMYAYTVTKIYGFFNGASLGNMMNPYKISLYLNRVDIL